MSKMNILVEVVQPRQQQTRQAFTRHASLAESEIESVNEMETAVSHLAGYGLEVDGDSAPVPMFGDSAKDYKTRGLTEFNTSSTNDDIDASSLIVPCQVARSKVEELQARDDVQIWPNSPLSLFQECECAAIEAA